MKNVLITGAAGFIGSHTCDDLLKSNKYKVYAVDDLSSGMLCNISHNLKNKNFQFFNESFDSDNIIKLVESGYFNFVIHLAAKPSVPWSIENFSKSHDVNVFKTIKLLESSIGKIDKFIFASSAAVYGKTFEKFSCVLEEDETLPISPYGYQKLEIEKYLNMFRTYHNINYVCFRFFNVYGPRQYGGHPYANVISSWMHDIKTKTGITLHGDGSQKRDFIYVKDVSRTLVASLENNTKYNVINLGTNINISCLEIIDLLKKYYKDVSIKTKPSRPGDIKETMANITLLVKSKIIDCENFLSFQNGLEETIKWWDKEYESK